MRRWWPPVTGFAPPGQAAPAGATVLPGWPEGVDPGVSAEAFGFAVGLFFTAAEPGGDQELAPLSEVIGHEHRRAELQAAWARYFADLLAEVIGYQPPPVAVQEQT